MDSAPSAAISERFGRLFDTLDSDNDASITWDDYKRLVERYVEGYKLAPDDRRMQAIHTSYHMLWLELLRHSSAFEPSLDRETFVSALHAASEDRSRFNMTEGVAEAAFDLVDADDDGTISEAEFVEYAEVLGVAVDTAWDRFKTLDTDGDGFISREEFVLSAREFLFGDDTDSAGGFVFGMI